MTWTTPERLIRTEAKRSCPICGAKGNSLYTGLRDTIFNVPGDWSFRRCPTDNCGLIWLDPAPIEIDIHQAYRSYYTHEVWGDPGSKWLRLYGRVRSKLGRLHLKWSYGSRGENRQPAAFLTRFLLSALPPGSVGLEFPMRMLPSPETGRVLEIGFGQGWLLKSLADLGWDAEGIEADDVTVANAKQRGLKVNCGTIPDQHYPDNCFDAIVSSHVIEHLHEPLLMMCEARRILRPGGRFIAATPNANSMTRRWFGAAWRGLEPPRHLHIFTPESIKALAQQAGFTDLEILLSARGAVGEWNNSRQIQHRTSRPDLLNSTLPKWHGLAGHIVTLLQLVPGLIDVVHRTELVLVATK